MKKILIMFSVLLMLVGCNHTDKDLFTRDLSLDSLPEGAQIILNGFNIGKTPLTVSVQTNELGCFANKVIITAIPSDPKHFTQVKSFPAYRDNDDGKSSVPEKVIFNMYKDPSENESVEVED